MTIPRYFGGFDTNWAILIVGILAIAIIPFGAIAEKRVVLQTVQNPALAKTLARRFTLPLLFDHEGSIAAEVSAEARKLVGILHSLGYLDGQIDVLGSGTIDDPLRIQPIPGPLYRIGRIQLDGLPPSMPELSSLSFDVSSAGDQRRIATQEALQEISKNVVLELNEASYGKANVAKLEITTDPHTLTAAVTINILAGPSLKFGDVLFNGSYRYDNQQAQSFVPFSSGDPYSKTAIEALQTNLNQSEQFHRVRIELAKQAGLSGQIDIEVELRDSPPDPDALAKTSGLGPTRLILTILMLAFLECVRVTTLWSHRSVRRALSIPVILMVSVSGWMVLERLYGFLL